MKKRVISALLVILISFLSLSGRLFFISSDSDFVSVQPHIRVRELGNKKGTVYDRNGKQLTNNKTKTIICAKPTAENAVLISKLKGKEYAKNTILKGNFTSFDTEGNNYINDSEDIKTFNIFERYGDSVALHLIGYTDIDGNGVAGIEKYYEKQIEEHKGKLSVAYSADALGRMLTGEKIEIRNDNYYSQGGIMLTIDRKIQVIVENALKNGSIDKGAAVVLDVKSSAILACASTPIYERDNISEYLNSPDSPFLNRAFESFPVGSVFKPVTAAAALENGIKLKEYNCKGYIEKSANKFNCNKLEGHGTIDFDSAIAMSCNPYFIELSTQIGAKKLLDTARNLGFGKSINLGNGFITSSGSLPDIKELNSSAAVGNLGFGQGKLTASPLQIALCFATIANDGIYNTPYIYKGSVDSNGNLTPSIQKDGKRVLSKITCKTIKCAMAKTTTAGTGKAAFTSLFDSCTKTATAQSGQYNENGIEIKYCWFVGFFPAESPKYVVCILKENGSSGGMDGAPVFKEISENIYINDISH
ncbi:MAG: penicillin-binding protein 2 [Ruminococcaceae bacterium]|nr:penicillin-binding protein 2 [Oscillospiraceae bacterium]